MLENHMDFEVVAKSDFRKKKLNAAFFEILEKKKIHLTEVTTLPNDP